MSRLRLRRRPRRQVLNLRCDGTATRSSGKRTPSMLLLDHLFVLCGRGTSATPRASSAGVAPRFPECPRVAGTAARQRRERMPQHVLASVEVLTTAVTHVEPVLRHHLARFECRRPSLHDSCVRRCAGPREPGTSVRRRTDRPVIDSLLFLGHEGGSGRCASLQFAGGRQERSRKDWPAGSEACQRRRPPPGNPRSQTHLSVAVAPASPVSSPLSRPATRPGPALGG